MARKKPSAFDLLQTKEELASLLNNFSELVASGTADVRAQVLELIPAFYLLRRLGTNILPEGDSIGARGRILIYLQRYPEKVIDSDELLVISGITDYQRRIRELRSEMGWPVLGGNTIRTMLKEGEWDNAVTDVSSIKPEQYVFLTSGQDKEAAYRWKLSNQIRRKNVSIKDKLIEYFRENIGRRVTGEELSYLAKGATEWARRVRELRTEEGWPIKTRNTGNPELPVGVYVLEEDKQAEQHDRKIDDVTRVEVLKRDNFSCRKCGWNISMFRPEDPRRLLELHHLDYHADKGHNSVENLITICNVHHDHIHKHNMKKDDVLQWIQIPQ